MLLFFFLTKAPSTFLLPPTAPALRLSRCHSSGGHRDKRFPTDNKIKTRERGDSILGKARGKEGEDWGGHVRVQLNRGNYRVAIGNPFSQLYLLGFQGRVSSPITCLSLSPSHPYSVTPIPSPGPLLKVCNARKWGDTLASSKRNVPPRDILSLECSRRMLGAH